jgi:hypothetical protein
MKDMPTHIRRRQRTAAWFVCLGITLFVPSASAQTIGNRKPVVPGRSVLDEDSNCFEAVHALRNVVEPSKTAAFLKAQEADRDFVDRVAKFATAWTALMELRNTGVWNIKQARRTRKAFERLVHSRAWVEGSKE